MTNLIVSYDLMSPGQNYQRVAAAIQSLGPWAKLLESTWYVKTDLNCTQALDVVAKAADRNDKVLVVEASSAAARNVDLVPWKFLLDRWNGATTRV